MRIVFMGTPDYAVNTLQALIAKGHSVEAVFAQPDKPVGRKHILTAPPVKVCAIQNNIKVYQPQTLRDGEAETIIKEINPDVIVVIAYGKILPKSILEIAKYGCVNAHASLLPKYRGAAPIQWAIINGETETGVTTMLMDEGVDTGDILEQATVKIGEDETAEQLFERLSRVSAELILSTLEKLEKDEIKPTKQEENEACYAPIIKKEMAKLDFKNQTAKQIADAVRGYYSWPCAFFFLDTKRIKVIRAKVLEEKTLLLPSSVVSSENEIVIACKDGGMISLLEIQPEGSKPMTAKQFLCGNTLEAGRILGE